MYKIQVIDGGPEVYDALAYGEKHPSTLQFLKSQFDNVVTKFTDAGQQFFAGGRELYDKFNGSEAMRLARMALNKVHHVLDMNNIHSLWDLVKMQQAGTVMQRWIMAEPTVREMYHQQRCDGFSETYVDMQPGAVGEAHYDYRRVMNGMLQDDEEHDWVCVTYGDELVEGDRDLSLDEQTDIITTWQLVKMHMDRKKEDPTSPFGASL